MLTAGELTERVIGPAIEVHRHTGPGLLESAYEHCLCLELRSAGIAFERQVSIPMMYKSVPIGAGFKADIVVAREVIPEVKSVAAILAVHEAQRHTYLRMSGLRVGLILNFNARRLAAGIRRYVASPPSNRGRTDALRLAERHGYALFGALVIASALRAGSRTLWSEDMQDGMVIDGRLRIADPFRAAP